MKTIGLDIGTTTISAVVADTITGKVEKAYTVKNDSFLETAEVWEKLQDPETIIKKCRQLLEGIVAENPEIGAIGLTGQMHGIVYVDQEGNHVSPLYTWQDQRGDLCCFSGESVCTRVKKETGQKIYTGYGLATHLYLTWKKEVPEGAKKICSIADYLGMVLTGRKEPLVHSSNGASFGLYDVEHNRFLTECLEYFGIDSSILPEITDHWEQIGTYQGIPVVSAIGDNQASFLGTVKEPETSILVNMGTGGQIAVLSQEYVQAEGVETRPYGDGNYLLVGSSLCGGRAYALLEQFFRSYTRAAGIDGLDHYQVMANIMEEAQKINRWNVTTTFSGTREEPEKRGVMEGIGVENFTPAAMIYGVLEGMAQELYEMYRQMGETVHSGKNTMMASGNGIRKNSYLRKIFEEKFGLRLQMAEQEEEAAYGAAMMGGKLFG